MNSSSSDSKRTARKEPDYEEGEIPSDADDGAYGGEGMQVTPARFDLDGKSKLFSVSVRYMTIHCSPA